MAEEKSTGPVRRELALDEIDQLASNLVEDIRETEAKLARLSIGVAIVTHADLELLRASAECIRCEVREARGSRVIRLDGLRDLSGEVRRGPVEVLAEERDGTVDLVVAVPPGYVERPDEAPSAWCFHGPLFREWVVT